MDNENTVNRSYRIKRKIMDEVTEDVLIGANCKTINEFVGDSIEFYTSNIKAGKSQRFLSKEIQSVIDGRLSIAENRLENVIFKLAVAVYASIYVRAAEGYIYEDSFDRVIRKSIDDVKGLNGYIDIHKIFGAIHGDTGL